jgi:hypothetical protein
MRWFYCFHKTTSLLFSLFLLFINHDKATKNKDDTVSSFTFDTLHFANRLKSVGFTDEQVQVLIELQLSPVDTTLEQARHDYHLGELATKRDLKEIDVALRHDLKEIEVTLKHEIELLRADTGRMIAESKADLTRWIIGADFLQTTLVIGVLLKITHLI